MINFVNHDVETTNHIEQIKCPVCNHIQDAIVEHTEIFNTYIHECENCQYLITESEWNKIETT